MPPSDPSTPPPPTIIIGAGVLGLSVAYTLLNSSSTTPPPPTRIILLTTEHPLTPTPTPSYASPWAGAHYRPIPATSPQLTSEAHLARLTASKMLRLADAVGERVCGVGRRRGREYFETRDPWQAELEREASRPGGGEGEGEWEGYAFRGDGFRVLDPKKGEVPEGVVWGCEYQTYCVNTPVYLRWLLKECQGRGMRVVQLERELESLGEAFEVVGRLGLGMGMGTLVDCSGQGVVRDSKVRIIRGQTVLVRKMAEETVTRQGREGWWSFLIPRPGGGGTVVGGTKEVGDWEGSARPETRAEVLRRTRECFPEFFGDEEVEVLRDIVGRRPWREGGLRIEREELGQGRRVVYGYGAGGRGYELSWGVAEEVVKLIRGEERVKASL